MVPVQLTADLEEELNRILEHMKLPHPLMKESGINIFQFGIPMEKTKEDSKKKFPYVLVAPQEGGIQGGQEPQKVSVQLLIGVYDDDLHNQGKKHVMNIINDICERFSEDPALKGRYYADEEIKWVVDTEEEYPYHYGAVWLVFNVPAFRRESEYA